MSPDKKLPRRNEKWMTLVLVVIVPLVLGGGYWVAAQEKDIDANELLSKSNKTQIQYLEKCEREANATRGITSAKLDAVVDTQQKVDKKIDRLTDMVIRILEKDGGD